MPQSQGHGLLHFNRICLMILSLEVLAPVLLLCRLNKIARTCVRGTLLCHNHSVMLSHLALCGGVAAWGLIKVVQALLQGVDSCLHVLAKHMRHVQCGHAFIELSKTTVMLLTSGSCSVMCPPS